VVMIKEQENAPQPSFSGSGHSQRLSKAMRFGFNLKKINHSIPTCLPVGAKHSRRLLAIRYW
jgi:hypothetical protein